VVLEWLDGLLIHPLVGPSRHQDLTPARRVRACRIQAEHYYPGERVLVSLFPAPMWFAGPREALFHALVRRNYGCTHFIVGRDHAGAGGFYNPLAAQKIFDRFTHDELGIQPIPFRPSFFCRRCAMTATDRTCPHGNDDRQAPSGTRIRDSLTRGIPVPEEVMRPEVWWSLRSGVDTAGGGE
jgi:ATP sulfurylase